MKVMIRERIHWFENMLTETPVKAERYNVWHQLSIRRQMSFFTGQCEHVTYDIRSHVTTCLGVLTPMNEMIPVDLPGGGLRTQTDRK